MYIDTTFPPPTGRLALLMRLVADFERDDIEAAVDGFIAMLDQHDGDADLEDDDSDRCAAGDDHMIAGAVASLDHWDPRYHADAARIGDDVDAEANEPPAYQVDQRRPLFVTAANDWPEIAA